MEKNRSFIYGNRKIIILLFLLFVLHVVIFQISYRQMRIYGVGPNQSRHITILCVKSSCAKLWMEYPDKMSSLRSFTDFLKVFEQMQGKNDRTMKDIKSSNYFFCLNEFPDGVEAKDSPFLWCVNNSKYVEVLFADFTTLKNMSLDEFEESIRTLKNDKGERVHAVKVSELCENQ